MVIERASEKALRWECGVYREVKVQQEGQSGGGHEEVT